MHLKTHSLFSPNIVSASPQITSSSGATSNRRPIGHTRASSASSVGSRNNMYPGSSSSSSLSHDSSFASREALIEVRQIVLNSAFHMLQREWFMCMSVCVWERERKARSKVGKWVYCWAGKTPLVRDVMPVSCLFTCTTVVYLLVQI